MGKVLPFHEKFDAVVSGDRIDLQKFLAGWILGVGHPTGRRSIGHFYIQRTFGDINSLCGVKYVASMSDVRGFVAFEPGDYDRCQRCQRKLSEGGAL